MKEKWIIETKKADFDALGKRFGITPLVARCIVNRGYDSEEAIDKYINATLDDLYDPFLMKGVKEGVELLLEAKDKGVKIAIASDFDCDGIFSGFLLWKALKNVGLDAKVYTPDRVVEGYGVNERIVDEAIGEDRMFLLTCDNGIAANDVIDLAKEKGMTVIVTDHHEVQDRLPNADVVIDPKQDGETYPFLNLCGAGVAFKLMCALYKKLDLAKEETYDLLEYAAIATVADVMELRDENRIIVKYGLDKLIYTKNLGLRTLLEVLGLKDGPVNPGHVGFTIGPCFNAAGRISDVEKSFSLLREENPAVAMDMAKELCAINEERKEMTNAGAKMAFKMIEAEGELKDVLVILLPDVHESVVGIIASRIKERYNHPTIVFSRTEDGLIKGSGRSIAAYDMFFNLCQCKDLMVRFGGHKMAAGMTIKESDLEELTDRLNASSPLEKNDFISEVRIDAAMPIGYADERMIEEFKKMEPFGVGNARPVFAQKNLKIKKGFVLGKNQNVLKLKVTGGDSFTYDAMIFSEKSDFEAFIEREWGIDALRDMYEGRDNAIDFAMTYFPSINEYNGFRNIQLLVNGYCRI